MTRVLLLSTTIITGTCCAAAVQAQEPAPAAKPASRTWQAPVSPRAHDYSADETRDPFRAVMAVPPAVPRAPAATVANLQAVSLDALQWLGSVRRIDQVGVLLRTPDGHVHLARLHDRIGLQQAEIVAVDDQELRLRIGDDASGRLQVMRLQAIASKITPEQAR